MRGIMTPGVLAGYGALGLPVLGGGQEFPEEFDFPEDPFFPEVVDNAPVDIPIAEAIDAAARPEVWPYGDGGEETTFWDPNTGAWTTTADVVEDQNGRMNRVLTDVLRDRSVQNLAVDKDGNIVQFDGSPADPSALKALGGIFSKAFGATVDFLDKSPNLSRALATLGLGAAGMGIGRLFAGDGGKLTLPSFEQGQNPAVAAAQPSFTSALAAGGTQSLRDIVLANLQGQRSLASGAGEDIMRAREANAAIEADSAPIRSLALANLPHYLQGTAPTTSPAYDAQTGAVLDQLEILLGVAPGTLNKPPAQQAGGYTFTDDQVAAMRAHLAKESGSDPSIVVTYAQRHGVGGLTEDPADVAKGYALLEAALRPPGTPSTRRTLAGVTQDPNLPALERRFGEVLAGGPDAYRVPDPTGAAMADRIQRALEGGELDPLTERRIRDELEILKNNLKRAYGATGAEWESTVGQNLYLKALESAEGLRYNVNKDVIQSLGPQEMARRTFQINNPRQLYLNEAQFLGGQTSQRGQLPAAERRTLLGMYLPQVANNAAFNENARQAGIVNNAALSSLNRPTLAPGATALNSQWGTLSPALGINEPNTFPTLANASLAAFQANQAARAGRANSVADIFGNAAAALRPPFTFATPSGSDGSSARTILTPDPSDPLGSVRRSATEDVNDRWRDVKWVQPGETSANRNPWYGPEPPVWTGSGVPPWERDEIPAWSGNPENDPWIPKPAGWPASA